MIGAPAERLLQVVVPVVTLSTFMPTLEDGSKANKVCTSFSFSNLKASIWCPTCINFLKPAGSHHWLDIIQITNVQNQFNGWFASFHNLPTTCSVIGLKSGRTKTLKRNWTTNAEHSDIPHHNYWSEETPSTMFLFGGGGGGGWVLFFMAGNLSSLQVKGILQKSGTRNRNLSQRTKACLL